MFIRNPYNYDRFAASQASGLECPEVTRTVQSDRDDADINVLVRRFGITGVMPSGVRPPTFADYDDVFDFQTAQNAILLAKDAFMAMPADVRTRFDNDPGRFVEFCSEEKNLDEMRKLGLAVPLPPSPPEKKAE
ncbi:MAG: internal scaffolding protein [Microvirus sp.]|nr:MAG: internal scaffolding protein [Microvirus sp.]